MAYFGASQKRHPWKRAPWKRCPQKARPQMRRQAIRSYHLEWNINKLFQENCKIIDGLLWFLVAPFLKAIFHKALFLSTDHIFTSTLKYRIRCILKWILEASNTEYLWPIFHCTIRLKIMWKVLDSVNKIDFEKQVICNMSFLEWVSRGDF